MELQDGATAKVRVAQASLNIESLAPGRYTASVIVSMNGRTLTHISRVIDIVR